ncbi:LysR family transcriptional regulator [Paraburkholderia heleia]|uniref:LysR family transcriptional regulator n=1 Tax=Paraburkholderia heleia TaxID=634127 RepID=UPI0031D404D4
MHYDDPNSLKLFLAVCETGSIAKAAEREAISASALSKRISDLEASFDTVLLNRGQRGVTPTTAGEALATHARHVLASLSRMKFEVSEYGGGVRGDIRIYAIATAIAEFLPEEITGFLGANAQVRINLEEKVTAEVLRGVENGNADIGICREVPSVADLEVRPLGFDQFVVVTSIAHPLAQKTRIAFEDTLDFDHVGLSRHASLRAMLNRAANGLEREVRVRLYVSSFDAALRVIRSGVAIGILPIEAIGRFRDVYDLRIIPLDERWATQNFVICIKRADDCSPAARRLYDHLLARSTTGEHSRAD